MKNLKWIPILYFPTSVILVDDETDFLKVLSVRLAAHNIAYKTFTDPRKALKFFQKNKQTTTPTKQALEHLQGEEIEGQPVILDSPVNLKLPFPSLHQLPFCADRFEQPTIVVIDHVMPHMNGLKLAEELRQLNIPLKIIMLTGQADDNIGIQGMNEGPEGVTINYFIKKVSADLFHELPHIIYNLNLKYFQERSKITLDILKSIHLCCLDDPVFINLFEKIRKDYKIIEYYLWEAPGTFLLLSESKIYVLVVTTDAQIQDTWGFLKDEEAPESLQSPLKNRKKTLFFVSKEERHTLLKEWKKFLVPIKKLPGLQNHYYGFIKDLSGRDIDQKRILFYKNFLDR